jgi:hypothetical protein
MPAREVMPGTLKRSPKKAQELWGKVHDAAAEAYGDGERAHRTAFASLKHSFEKVDDHWERKKRRGPSDPRSEIGGAAARDGKGETFGGVDFYGHTKTELYQRAKRLGVKGRSRMDKRELARAIDRAQD